MILNTNPLIDEIIKFNQLNEDQINQLKNPQTLEISNDEAVLAVVERLKEAQAKNERIFICGDYDCDGLSSTSILVSTLRQMGCEVGFYIPNRFKDGYGINVNIAKLALNKNYDLTILLDNGVSAFEAIDLIQSHNKEVIVIDHHEIHTEVKAEFLLHPDVLSDHYQSMCTSGLVHLISYHLVGYQPYLCALAGLATIADMMPLWNYNRVLVLEALKEMNQHRFLQLTSLLKNSNETFTEEVCSFQIIPKLNAVGRLADVANPNRVVDYLCLDDKVEIMNLAQQINQINEQRKNLHQVMVKKAHSMISDDAVIMLADESFHEGVVGITAGQLSNFYQKVTLVMHDDGQRLKGSVRSYGNIHLRELFEPALHLVSKYGGHGAAAGIEIEKEHFEAFKILVNENSKQLSTEETVIASIDFDPSIINVANLKGLSEYAPYGMSFMIPSVKIKDAEILEIKPLKTGRKIRMLIGEKSYDVLDFNQQSVLLKEHQVIDLIARFTLNSFRGVESISLFTEKIN